MSAIQEIRKIIRRAPLTPNKQIASKLGVSNSLVSRERRRLGLLLQPWQSDGTTHVRLPAYMTKWLSQQAAEMGEDVTIQDAIIAMLVDLMHEEQEGQA